MSIQHSRLRKLLDQLKVVGTGKGYTVDARLESTTIKTSVVVNISKGGIERANFYSTDPIHAYEAVKSLVGVISSI